MDSIAKKFLSNFDNYETTKEETVILQGNEARIIEGHFFHEGVSIKNIQLVSIKENSAVIVTGTVAEFNWERYKDLIRDSILTFELF